MDWSSKRQLLYGAGVFLIAVLLLFLSFRNVLIKEPTCGDGKKNGNETGIDCGGDCVRYCQDTLGLPKVRWFRFFPVTNGFFHALAYIEHPYPNAGIKDLSYTFKIFDEENRVIAERTGKTFVGSFGKSAIFEPLIKVADKIPYSISFEINKNTFWEKLPNGTTSIQVEPERTILDESQINETKLSVNLFNQSELNLYNVVVIAILYDEDGNAITVSKTEIPSFGYKERKTVYFTWPFDLSAPVARTEIVTRVDPFKDAFPR